MGTRTATATPPTVRAQHTSLVPPPWLVIPAGVALLFVIVPFIGMFADVPWNTLGRLLSADAAQDALWLSLKTTLISTLASIVLGVPLAHVLALANSPDAPHQALGRALRLLLTLPMVIPPVVAGLALLTTFGRRGLLGSFFHTLGIDIGFTTTAVILAQIFVSMPFLVISLEGALRTRGMRLEGAARNLGASRTQVFFEITLPVTLPAVASGTALTFARSLGEFGATITFAGSLQGVTRTLPLEIYLQREIDTPTALALATVLLLVAVVVIGAAGVISAISSSRLSESSAPKEDEPEISKLQAICDLKDLDVSRSQWEGANTAIELHAGADERGVRIDADIKHGLITALVGPNGSGKSTAIEMIAGTLPPTSGSVRLNLGKMNPTIVWLEQNALLFPHLNVEDNVAFGPRARGLNTTAARARALEELDAVGCRHLKDRLPTQLSGGQAQRVAIARALAVDPDLILLDEPFAAVDSEVAWALRLVLRRRIRDAHATAVMVTHDLTDAAFISDHTVVLEAGTTAESGFTPDVLEHPTSQFLINLTGANVIDSADAKSVIRPENIRVLDIDSEADAAVCGTVIRRAFTPSGEIAIVRLEDGSLISIGVNTYNRERLQSDSVRLEL